MKKSKIATSVEPDTKIRSVGNDYGIGLVIAVFTDLAQEVKSLRDAGGQRDREMFAAAAAHFGASPSYGADEKFNDQYCVNIGGYWFPPVHLPSLPAFVSEWHGANVPAEKVHQETDMVLHDSGGTVAPHLQLSRKEAR
jgi:hypothetical protein